MQMRKRSGWILSPHYLLVRFTCISSSSVMDLSAISRTQTPHTDMEVFCWLEVGREWRGGNMNFSCVCNPLAQFWSMTGHNCAWDSVKQTENSAFASLQSSWSGTLFLLFLRTHFTVMWYVTCVCGGCLPSLAVDLPEAQYVFTAVIATALLWTKVIHEPHCKRFYNTVSSDFFCFYDTCLFFYSSANAANNLAWCILVCKIMCRQSHKWYDRNYRSTWR